MASKPQNRNSSRRGRKNPQFAAIDELYGLPLGEFTAARDDLRKRLQKEGDREAAEAVAAARKPTIAAWAVNQLVRQARERVLELRDLGDDLRAAQRRAFEQRDPSALLELSERERSVVRELVGVAAKVLADSGARASDATLEAVGETLHAAALDEDAGAMVAGGRLTGELRSVGLGLGGVPAPGRRGKAKPGPKVERRPSARVVKARERLAAAREAAHETAKAAREAQRAADRAHREAEQAAERERRAADALAEAERS